MSGIKRWWTALAAGVLTVMLAVIGWSQSVAIKPMERRTMPADTCRVIRVWNGRVAVFLPDAERPERVFDTPVSVLPTEEQQRLQAGVYVETMTALYERLEDYIG